MTPESTLGEVIAAFVLRLVAASVWQSPGPHHQPRNRYEARCAIHHLYEAAYALDPAGDHAWGAR